MEAAPRAEARQLNRRLRDTEDHLGQFSAQLAHGADGVLYLARAGLANPLLDVEPYPRLTPQSRAGEPPDVLLDLQNDAALRRLENSLSDYGLQELSDTLGQHVLARANPITTRPVHDLQVVWLGSRRRWAVMPGGLRWREYDDLSEDGAVETKTRLYEKTYLDGVHGWIIIPVDVTVQDYDSRDPGHLTGQSGYQLTPHPIGITGGPQHHPPTRSLDSGELSFGVYWNTVTWKSGQFLLPIAYVEAPGFNGHRSPFIHQAALGSWNVSSDASPYWSGTWPRSSFIHLEEEA